MVGIFSFFANLLMLTGPIYMLQVYDRVLGSRSEETLIALSILVAFLYGIMGILDYTRGRSWRASGQGFNHIWTAGRFRPLCESQRRGKPPGLPRQGWVIWKVYSA